MIKSKEIVGPSCLTRAADDEPLFVLRANDEIAPDVVRAWANRYVVQKGDGDPSGLSDAQRSKVLEAFDIADKMEDWKRAQS